MDWISKARAALRIRTSPWRVPLEDLPGELETIWRDGAPHEYQGIRTDAFFSRIAKFARRYNFLRWMRSKQDRTNGGSHVTRRPPWRARRSHRSDGMHADLPSLRRSDEIGLYQAAQGDDASWASWPAFAHSLVRSCRMRAFHLTYHPEAEGHWVLPGQELGLDIIVRVGELRYREHRSCPEIHTLLREEGTVVSARSVLNLLAQYDLLLSLALETLPERVAELASQGRVILSIDGLQPDVGHEVLWVVRDVLSGAILCARSLLSSCRAELQALIEGVVAALPVKVAAVVSDGQRSLRDAVAVSLPGVPHQLCQFHYLREAARPLWEADRHAKKELKKRVRDVRGIERSAERRTDIASEVVLGYCSAVRSALTDDARPPLAFAGLRLAERLEQIHDSLDRLGKKGGRCQH